MPSRHCDGLLLLLRAAETIDHNEKFDPHPMPSHSYSKHVSKHHSTSRDFSTLSSPGRCMPQLNSRCSHNELEKTRRAHLRNCMESLKQRLNFEGDTAARITMLTVLKKASSTIQSLMHQNQIWEHRETKEKRRYNQLIVKRQALRKKRDLLLRTQKLNNFQSWRERNSVSECSITTTSSEDSEVDFTLNHHPHIALVRYAQTAFGYTNQETEESSDSGYRSPKMVDQLDGALAGAKIGVVGSRMSEAFAY